MNYYITDPKSILSPFYPFIFSKKGDIILSCDLYMLFCLSVVKGKREVFFNTYNKYLNNDIIKNFINKNISEDDLLNNDIWKELHTEIRKLIKVEKKDFEKIKFFAEKIISERFDFDVLFKIELEKIADRNIICNLQYNIIWGIGLPSESKDKDDLSKWKSKNIYGYILNELLNN